MLSTMIYDDSQAHAKLKEQLKQVKDQLSASKEETKKYKQANKTLMGLMKNILAALCRAEILLQDAALSIEHITQDRSARSTSGVGRKWPMSKQL